MEYLVVDGKITLKHIFKKYGVMLWTRLNWLRTESSGGLL